ncbi:TonB-dependent receptor domain-containing protein [Pseudoalteromonas tunicata]|uniref:TonB-dependent receptor domain-containing protein n=1 Tax=Pseudoalteromonas tunicata TaxID=314281 RepID=UPI00273D46F3|nr:TonB-dependent receptor [Pseudoalteromonas tunicata]MDP4984554.1 TonB-dependent receptor [Pseudoalteromonas tunicata]
MKYITFKKCLIACAISSAFIGQTYANEQSIEKTVINDAAPQSSTAKDELPEKITVTGSRLRRDSFSVATPLVTMDKAEIQDSGLGSLSEILVEGFPAISEGSSNTNSQSSVQNTGLSTIDLRNLGTNRTLTLIDGRRVVSNSYSGNYVSLSTIPTGMVDRVEIISGGASATYGSDAVAGVVNIITQSKKEGAEIKARAGSSTEGGAEEFSLDLSYGSSFDNENGYLFFSTTIDRQLGISFNDRKRAAIETDYRYNTTKMCNEMNTENDYQCMADITKADWRDRSDGTLGGVFLEASQNGTQFWYDESGLRNDWKDNEERFGVNSAQWEDLKIPEDRMSAAIKFDYDFNSSLSGYFQVQYAQNDSENVKSPEDEYEGAYALVLDPITGEASRVAPGYIPINNPYVPQEILDANPYKNRIYWDRRFGEVGEIVNDNKRTTLRTWAGLQGTAFNDQWDWDLSVGFGKFKQKQNRYNELNTFHVNNALQAEYADDGVTIQCKDEAARADGCVPLNLFGIGSITPEAADYIRANPTITTDIEQFNVLGYMTGDLFELPAGTVTAVFGGEFRRDSQKVKTSKEQEFGGITFNVVPTFSGDVEVSELFAEAAIPLLKDAPGAKNLTAELSARIADYSWSNTGLVGSYKVGLIWEPIAGYAIRANYALAQRAPTITELVSPPRGDYDTFTDICNGVTATSTNPGHDNCRKEPTIAAVIADEGVFKDGNNSYSPNTGNTELKEESADTYTLGMTFAPSFLDGFRLAVDYYDIKISDAIAQIDNADIIQQCYDSALPWGTDNRFCNDITRDTEGNIIEILQRSFNLDELRTRGYDVAAEYKFDLTDLGSLTLKADLTHVIEYSKTFATNDGIQTNQYAGQLDNGIFTDRASMSLAWSYEGLRLRWSTKFRGAMIDSQSRADSYLKAIEANNERCAANDVGCIANPEQLAYHELPSYTTHNISASYNFALSNSSDMRVSGGLNNVFDNKGPFVLGGTGNFDSSYGGGVGRFAYLSAEVRF